MGGRSGDGCSKCGKDLLAPSHCSLISSSSPLTPRDAHTLGAGTHSSLLGFVWVDLWNSRREQKRRTDRHACEVALDTASRHTSAFFLLNHTFLLFFITVFSLFLSILVLSTKIILNVVLFSFSPFILSSNLVFICPFSLPSFSPSCTCLLWLWEKLELKGSNLAVNGVVLSNCVVY